VQDPRDRGGGCGGAQAAMTCLGFLSHLE
jgi:hypothetical protein